MSHSCYKATIVVGLLLSCSSGYSQVTSDSSYQSPLQVAMDEYHRTMYPENLLFNGIEYQSYNSPFAGGHPYFLSSKPLPGSLVYEGILFEDVNLMYDLLKEQVVLIQPLNYLKVKLNPVKLGSFTIDGHRFIHLSDEVAGKKIRPGFYELLYPGTHAYLIKKFIKTVSEELSSSDGVLKSIKEAWEYFVKKGDTYYALSNKRSVLKIFEDRKKEMQQYLKSHRIIPKQDNQQVYVQIVGYYNSLFKAETPNQ